MGKQLEVWTLLLVLKKPQQTNQPTQKNPEKNTQTTTHNKTQEVANNNQLFLSLALLLIFFPDVGTRRREWRNWFWIEDML